MNVLVVITSVTILEKTLLRELLVGIILKMLLIFTRECTHVDDNVRNKKCVYTGKDYLNHDFIKYNKQILASCNYLYISKVAMPTNVLYTLRNNNSLLPK